MQGHRFEGVSSFPRERRRTPPAMMADLDLEAQVIGAVLFSNAYFRDCAFLEPEIFTDPVHAELWGIILGLLARGVEATPTTVAMEMDPARLGAIGGRNTLSSITMLGESLGPALGAAAARLRQLFQKRALCELRDRMDEWIATDGMSAEEAVSETMKGARSILTAGRSTLRSKSDVARAAIEEALELRPPATTGLESLDFVLQGGLRSKRLLGIGGLHGRGKTILISSISDHLNAIGEDHLVLSLETPPEDCEIRHCAKHLGMNAAQLYDQSDRQYPIFARNARNYANQVQDHTWYDYCPGASINRIGNTIIRASHLHGIKGFIIDYWQLIKGREKNQTIEQHLQEVSNTLATLCRTENLWGIVTAQTDQYGKLLYCPDGLKISCALYVRLVRDENDQIAFFETEKSNHSRYYNTGDASVPGMIFDMRGPHFKNTDAMDIAMMQHQDEDDIS